MSLKVYVQNLDPEKKEDQAIIECDRVMPEQLDGVVMINLYNDGCLKSVRSFDPLVYLCTIMVA